MEESFLVTALPFSADSRSDVHVSLFVTHRLTPHGAQAPLGDFPNASVWGERLAAASIRLTGSNGEEIGVTPRLAPIDPDLWGDVFPRELPVRPWSTPELAAVPWRTFPAHRMDTYAKLVHMVAAFASPVTKPALLPNVVKVLADGRHGELDRDRIKVLLKDRLRSAVEAPLGRLPRGDKREESPLFWLSLLDQELTAQLDEDTGAGTVHAPGKDVEPLSDALFDLHLARRYYERPEEQRPYRDVPDGTSTPPPPAIDPDFHQRCALLGDTPGILRELGLVVDLAVDDVKQLAGLEWIAGHIVAEGFSSTSPRVSCQVDGGAFTTVSSSGDFVGGALRLGDEDRFRVLDLDPDATALKLERFLRSLPRLLYSELNGDPANAAPSSLRSAGFAITRVNRAAGLRERLTNMGDRDADLLKGGADPLDTESVTRGLRLEVWDDESGRWHSLHRRRIDIEVNGALVVDDEPDEGFLQGAALTRADEAISSDPNRPYHAHEAVAGWEGWSLSAPRPGRVVFDGDQPLGDPPEEPRVTPVAVTSAVEPGTLPLLRYGRSYAFRAWAVDLAGNSPPRAVAHSDRPASPASDVANTAATELAAKRGTPSEFEQRLTNVTRAGLLSVLKAPAPVPGPRRPAPRLDRLRVTGVSEVDSVVRRRLASREARRPLDGPSRAVRIERTMAAAVGETPTLVRPTAANVPPDVLARALAGVAEHAIPPEFNRALELFLAKGDLLTSPRPFLRWDPVLPPAWVPRRPYSEGESLLTLVVRSGVELDASGSVILTDPAAYAASTIATRPELVWRGESERHLAPPKTSQLESEQHGKFDDAFGPSATAAQRRTALAASMREEGTFLDTEVRSLTTPGATEPQPGVSLHHTPTADPEDLVDLTQLKRGEPLGPGQYVVHDVADLVLPYLPDPLAHGVSLVFPDAGRGRPLQPLFATEGLTLPYGGAWPAVEPYRLVLQNGPELHGEVDGRAVNISVPPGEQLRMRVSSCLADAALKLLGIWMSLPEGVRETAELAEAARDGWMWWLTPYEEVRLVHAVPRPVERPRVTTLVAGRKEGDVAAALIGAVDIHGPSTERLDLEANWTERVDDIAKPIYEDVSRTAAATGTEVDYDEDLVVFVGPDDTGDTIELPEGERLVKRRIAHVFEDTKHRLVDYTVRATTRYREFFPPAVVPTIDDISLVSLPSKVSVPSSARPAQPVVRDVIPLFRWDDETEPHQPFGHRRTRRSGLRIYLERPWFSSGDGELLGIVLGEDNERLAGSLSQWGADPVWRQDGPPDRTFLPLINEAHLRGVDDRPDTGRPAVPLVDLPLVDIGDPGRHPTVSVLGYRPEFCESRGLWFVDVAFDPGNAFWPFVRLAVVRYQPDSLPGMHLSPVVVCDFAQLTPSRTATLTRPSATEVRVIVSGVVGERRGDLQVGGRASTVDRVVFARLEQHGGVVAGDLGWSTVLLRVLPVRGRGEQTVSWGDVLDLPEAIPPERPGGSSEWRVTVEEWEVLPADDEHGHGRGVEGRLVYADHLPL